MILAKTIKGFHLGRSFEGRNATHQMKKMTLANLKEFRDNLHIPIAGRRSSRPTCTQPPYYHPGPECAGDRVPAWSGAPGSADSSRSGGSTAKPLVLPGDTVYDVLRRGSGKQEIATTMAFVRLVRDLFKDPEIGKRIVPIIPDEARTFGMDSFFPTQKIYNPHGQLYTAVDAQSHVGVQGIRAGRHPARGHRRGGFGRHLHRRRRPSYATHGEPMIPMYIFYSMFGFQRTGDGIWAAGDQMGRGFVLGATAGRTTPDRRGPAARRRAFAAAGRRPSRTSSPTTRPTATRSGTSSRTVCAGCTAAATRTTRTARTSSTTSPCTTSPTCSRREPDGLDVDGLLKGMYLLSPAAETEGKATGAAARLRASGCAGRWRPSSCWRRTGTWPPTSGR